MDEQDFTRSVGLERLGYTFLDKPLVVGGMAMEYYGLRAHGDDVDFIVTDRDYQGLKVRFPGHRKDVWGDFGVLVQGFELFRSMYKLDYPYYSQGSVELDSIRVVSIDILFRMKALALGAAPKHDADFQLLKQSFLRFQNPRYQRYLDTHLERYTSSPTGIFYPADHEDE